MPKSSLARRTPRFHILANVVIATILIIVMIVSTQKQIEALKVTIKLFCSNIRFFCIRTPNDLKRTGNFSE